MNTSNIKVTHLGQDYSYVNIYIHTTKGSTVMEDIEVPLYIGEALAEAGETEGEEFAK